MFSDRRRLRRCAAFVLLVWLFGFAMGVANACALGESTHHRADHDAAASASLHVHGDEQGDSAKVNCLDFCEKPSLGASQSKAVDDGSSVLGCALPAAAIYVLGASATVAPRLAIDSPHLPGGPPPRIVFQRFTL